MISTENKLLLANYRVELANLPDDARISFHLTMTTVAEALYEHFCHEDNRLNDYHNLLYRIQDRNETWRRRAVSTQLQQLDKYYFRFVENLCNYPKVHHVIDDRNSMVAMKLFGTLIFLSGTRFTIDNLKQLIKDDLLESQYLVQNMLIQSDDMRLEMLKHSGQAVEDYFRNVEKVEDEKKLEEVNFFIRNLCYDEEEPISFDCEADGTQNLDEAARFRILEEKVNEMARRYGNTEMVKMMRETLENIRKKRFANGSSDNGNSGNTATE